MDFSNLTDTISNHWLPLAILAVAVVTIITVAHRGDMAKVLKVALCVIVCLAIVSLGSNAPLRSKIGDAVANAIP